MASLSDAFRAAIDSTYREFAVSARYTNRDSVTRTVAAVVDYDLSQYGETAEVAAYTATLAVRRSEVPEAPRRGERFVLEGGDELVVGSILASDDLEHTVLAS